MHCRIHVDNVGLFKPNSEIQGKVECNFNETVTARGIKIRLRCKEHNDWTGTESYYDHVAKKTKTRTVHYSGDNVIIAKEILLLGPDSHGEVKVGPGRHHFPFQFTLPSELPSSFEGPYGHVRYYLEAVVDRPWRFDYEDVFAFPVESPLYLDSFPPDDLVAQSFADEKTVCCLCCKGGNIEMEVELSKGAFVPGESADFRVKLTNLSNLNVDALIVKMKRIVTFIVTSPNTRTKESEVEMLRDTYHGVGAHGEYLYNLTLAIPSHIEVPNFSRCTLFRVIYRLKVVANLDGCSSNLDINIYPKMGHIQSARWVQHYSNNQNAFKPVATAPIPNTPPPAFEDDFEDVDEISGPSTLPEKRVFPARPPTAPFSDASAPPGPSASAPELPPPAYDDAYVEKPPK